MVQNWTALDYNNMIGKAENTSNNFHQQHRLSIFFRNPALLKVVAWLGSLGFIGSTGIVWADIKPISASQTETQALVIASGSARAVDAKHQDWEVFGPSVPAAWRPSPVATTAHATANQLPNREVPVAVVPGSSLGRVTSRIKHPHHADLLAAEHQTVGVNSLVPNRKLPAASANLPVSSAATSASQSREVVASKQSQIDPNNSKPRLAISRSIPATGLKLALSGHSASVNRVVPNVPSLPVSKSTQKQLERRGISIPTPIPISSTPKSSQRPFTGLKPVVLTPMKPTKPQNVVPDSDLGSSTVASSSPNPEFSIEIPVPPPRTQIIKVQPVTRLPQVAAGRSIPTIPAIPTVRSTPAGSSSKPVAFINNGLQQTSELIYPLSSPAPITSSFGWRTHPITGSRRFHSGLDIGAPMGAPVVAAGSGTIITAGWLGGYGKAIVIQHNGIQQTLYGHLSEVFVQPGQQIEQGTVIGRVGSTGNSTGPHLHYEARMATADGWVAVDPIDDVKYALDNLKQAMPITQRDLPPGYN